MALYIAFLSNPGHSKMSLSNLESRQWITISKTILAKRTMLLTFLRKLKKHTGGGQSVFDSISRDDLIMAFFPCIYFDCLSQMSFGWYNHNYVKLSSKEKADAIITRSKNRERFFQLAVKMFAVCEIKGIRMIMENPWSMQTFLKANFIVPPSIIDNDRSKRGDIYKKPTAYWFWGCEPTNGQTFQQLHKPKRIVDQPHKRGGGICSEVRSMISPDYARNFICDFVLGKAQVGTQLQLF